MAYLSIVRTHLPRKATTLTRLIHPPFRVSTAASAETVSSLAGFYQSLVRLPNDTSTSLVLMVFLSIKRCLIGQVDAPVVSYLLRL